MNGAQIITQILEEKGIHTLFGYPGGCIMPFYDALLDSHLKHVLCRHEQAAALAADGYARASDGIGVCIATSGPGATNLITGVANAYMDSIPMLVITGQVPSHLIGTDAFQETDVLGLTLGICKHSYLIDDVQTLPTILKQAIELATSGRPGPVWIDIPKDILLQECPCDEALTIVQTKEQTGASTCPDPASIANSIKMIQQAKRPLVYSGGGVTSAHALGPYRDFIHALNLPQVTTLKGIGNAGKNQPLDLGMLGMHGSRAANEAIHEADLIIAIGVRFDDRAIGKANEFAPNAQIIHMDIDPCEFNKNKAIDCPIQGDINLLLPKITQAFTASLSIDAWRAHCAILKEEKGFISQLSGTKSSTIQGPDFLSQLSKSMPNQSLISCDVGQHQMWVAQFMSFADPQKHLSSGGLGTMGYGLPAAIGAQLSNPDTLVINISGDGSFMMNVQELATIKRYGLPIKIIILDNQQLGMVRQQQTLFYQERYSEIDLSDNPEFTQLATAFGIHTAKIERAEQVPSAIQALIQYPHAMLLHVCISPENNVWPTVTPGAGNHNMIETLPPQKATEYKTGAFK